MMTHGLRSASREARERIFPNEDIDKEVDIFIRKKKLMAVPPLRANTSCPSAIRRVSSNKFDCL